MDRSNYNPGGYGRGRGRGGGKGVGGGGRGEDGGGRGRGGYFRGGRGRNYQHPHQYNQEYDQSQSQYGGGRGRSGGGNQQYDQSQSQYGGGRGRSGGGNGGGGRVPRSPAWQGERTNQMRDPGERTWARVATSESVDSSNLTQMTQSSLAGLQIQEVPEVEAWRVSSAKNGTENAYSPIKRPDMGGTIKLRSIHLLVNHFKVGFNPANTMLHYDVEVTREEVPLSRAVKKPIQKSDLRLIREKLCSDEPDLFPLLKTAYDGEKSIFSAVRLPAGSYKLQVFDGNDSKGRSYIFTIKLVNEVRQSKLRDYLNGNLLQMPRDVLQGMDLVMKENLFPNKVSVGKGGRGFYPREHREEDDLYCGVAAFRGFQQSLKTTSNGLALCLDYSVLAFRKRIPVMDFLKEHIQGFRGVSDVWRLRRDVVRALRGLKVTVTHRRTKQKYTIAGLTDRSTKDISFKLEDPEGKEEPKEVMLLTYFRQKWGKEVVHKDIPCLDVGNSRKPNYVPMEFCVLAEDRRFPKEELGKEAARKLKELSLLAPKMRRSEICRMMQEEYGSDAHGSTIQNFEFGVDLNMTPVLGRVMPPPNLKLGTLNGGIRTTTVDKDKCHWNLLGGKTVVDGKAAERWALIDFTGGERNRLNSNFFVGKLMNRCGTLGVRMEEPLVVYTTGMSEFESVDRLYGLLSHVKQEARKKSEGDLQIVVCVMAYKDDGYKSLKWVSETKIGVITQCCLSLAANKANDQYLANLGMKINAKLGGSNVELIERLPLFERDDHFMFIGADVNHPAASNKTCPSIAAVVASVNWPAATRYAARVSPQRHRQEEIANFGSICLDLVNTYGRLNGMKPNKIVVFRDGVSDGQFDMVLNSELVDLKKAIYSEHYRPTITIVVAQKRHMTRLFPLNERDVMQPGNVPPGTVVDTTIVHPFEFDFYLSSHFGGLGTSKPTHYSVLWDENVFNSDEIQKLVYYLCFTFARCTKPVSLVPPVYYADLVAYRGRIFQEVAMDQSPGSVSSSSSRMSASSSSSASSFNQVFYDLEPQLKNCMFFV